ncbi:hypothetical protein QQF64_022168 [Cirrhinus molitorella]|uniref:ribonuclease H n=1 Tax=Cirrhinus molitorella TaxID=172907 RepID=A0ABR3L8Y9_9TELE
MVPKPDGTLRFCNDFCRLNEISEFDGYPMPRVDELLDRLGRGRYISTLDLTKGYWQVTLTKEARPKMAFSTPSAYAAAYLDDVVVHSERWEDHLDRLRRVLMELRRAGLTANPRKCHLALSEAKYLGFQVGRGLIRPQEKKVAAILSAPRPTTKTQEGAAREGVPADQDGTHLQASPTGPGLQLPLQLLQLQTDASDASDTGLGAVLSQVQDGEEHPVIYISRKLTSAEKRYATVEREALAVKWAVLELRFKLAANLAPPTLVGRAVVDNVLKDRDGTARK